MVSLKEHCELCCVVFILLFVFVFAFYILEVNSWRLLQLSSCTKSEKRILLNVLHRGLDVVTIIHSPSWPGSTTYYSRPPLFRLRLSRITENLVPVLTWKSKKILWKRG